MLYMVFFRFEADEGWSAVCPARDTCWYEEDQTQEIVKAYEGDGAEVKTISIKELLEFITSKGE